MANYKKENETPDIEKQISNIAIEVDLKGPFWLTRDKTNGKLSDVIEVWLVKPDLQRFDDGDVMWTPSLEYVDTDTTHYAEWTIEQTRKTYYTVPDTERECIKVG